MSPSLLWDNYLAMAKSEISVDSSHYPGKNFVSTSAKFTDDWKYRKNTYEIHFNDKRKLGRTVYDLALHSGDISSEISLKKVEAGVEGFHYDIAQICSWLNDVFSNKRDINPDSFEFICYLIKDSVVTLKDGNFVAAGKIKHVLAAAEGKKRSFQQNLLHERLHVYWDEDEVFKKSAQKRWNTLSQQEKDTVNQKLKHYADNMKLRLEEWAVREAEQKKILLDKL